MVKRQIAHEHESDRKKVQYLLTCPPHPLGVKPGGAELMSRLDPSYNQSRRTGLGLLSRLDDDAILIVLEELDPTTLCSLSQCSKALYVFTRHESLWRQLVLRLTKPQGFVFQKNWLLTYAYHHCISVRMWSEDRTLSLINQLAASTPVQVPGLHSDAVYRPFQCATTDLHPDWFVADSVDRRANLSLDDFIREYEEPGRPVVITDVVTQWPAYKKWSSDYLVNTCGEHKFRAGAATLTMQQYVKYAEQVVEEAPLYLFDSKFADKIDGMADDYTVPVYFQEDLFSVLGDKRPDYRWLIAGPKRSGSVFHKDPNATSAWNAVISGEKKWIFYPPSFAPPGVRASGDGANVTVPLSLLEWFMNFYDAIKETEVKPLECIAKAGDLVFVPSGWWHFVFNLEDTVAITQNYVSRRNLRAVLRFLRTKSDQVSGLAQGKTSLYQDFKRDFDTRYPNEIEKYDDGDEQSVARSIWENITGTRDAHAPHEEFCFSFDDSDEAEASSDIGKDSAEHCVPGSDI